MTPPICAVFGELVDLTTVPRNCTAVEGETIENADLRITAPSATFQSVQIILLVLPSPY
jgi:hypothetical protein